MDEVSEVRRDHDHQGIMAHMRILFPLNRVNNSFIISAVGFQYLHVSLLIQSSCNTANSFSLHRKMVGVHRCFVFANFH
jgi:hypothetical protein